MKLFRLSLVIGIFALCTPTTYSEAQQHWIAPHFLTGEDLNRACQENRESVSGGMCLGYITGVVDASTGVEVHAVLEDGTNVLPLCLPDSISSSEILRDIVAKSMKDHPERLKNPAASVVRAAFQSFGCKSGYPNGVIPPTKKN